MIRGLKQERFMTQTFGFSPEDIDAAAAYIGDGMEKLGLTRKDALRNRLSVEEVLLRWREDEGLEGTYTIELLRRMGRVNMTLRMRGTACDPLSSPEDESFGTGDMGRSMLENLGLSLSWQYRDGVNVISVSQKIGRKMSQLGQVLIAVVLAAVLGALGMALPAAGRELITEVIINPLFNTFLGLLSCVVGPMMFLSMIWSIVNIGDTRKLGRIGGSLLIRFLLISSLFGVFCMAVTLFVLRPSLGSATSGEAVLGSIVEMVLNIVPGNIVDPFMEGNTLQILFMGAVVGIAMILLRDRMQTLNQVVEQANALIQFILSAISTLIPAFIFLSVLRLIFQGTLAQNMTGLLGAILLVLTLSVVELVLETLSMLKLGLSPVQTIKKLGQVLMVALTTASSAAAFPSMRDSSRKLGVDEKLTNFALPFGSVVFMAHVVNSFIVITVFSAQIYEIELTVGSLVVCLVNAVVLSVAAPPIPGGMISCFTLMFLSTGIPLEGISLVMAAIVVLDFTVTAGQVYDLLIQLAHGAAHLDMLDREMLHKEV